MGAGNPSDVRANICCRASIAEGYVLQQGAERKVYTDPHEACDDDPRFRDTYRLVQAGISAVIHGSFQPVERRELTPTCRVLAGTFACEGTKATLAIFTERINTRAVRERTLAIQVTHQDADGQYREFYTQHPRQCRHFEQSLASANLCFDLSENV